MADKPAKKKSVGLIIEQTAPPALALVTLAILLLSKGVITAKFAPQGWSANGLYSAVFNWAAIQTGFAFGVFGFVAGKSGGFVEAARGTVAMGRFLSYVKAANVAGFLLTVCSIPLLVTNPDLHAVSTVTYAFVAAWFSLFVWSFLAFLRIAYTFGHLTTVKDAPPFHGAGT